MADWDADDFEAEAPGKTVTTVVDKWEGEDDDSDCKVTAQEILELFLAFNPNFPPEKTLQS